MPEVPTSTAHTAATTQPGGRLRALLVADAAFADTERTLITRLELGLADEGVDVRAALPFDASEPEAYDLLNPPLMYRASSFRPFAKLAAGRVGGLLAEDWPPEHPRIVHAFGGGCWRFAAELAEYLDAVVVFEVWRVGIARRARRFDRSSRPTVFTAPGVSIERALLAEQVASPVRVTPWGGACAPVARSVLPPGETPAIVLMGRGRDTQVYRAAFCGALTAGAASGAHVFVDAEGAARANLWQVARSLDALPRVTLVDRLEDRRELLLDADVVLHPDARGEHRSALLDVMGAGLPVVATPDPNLAVLGCGEHVVCVESPATDAWFHAVSGLLETPSAAREVGASGRQLISEQFRWHQHVQGVLNLYEQIAGGLGRESSGAPEASGKGAA